MFLHLEGPWLQHHFLGQVAPEALGAWQVALKPQERRAWQYFTLCRASVGPVKVVEGATTADMLVNEDEAGR